VKNDHEETGVRCAMTGQPLRDYSEAIYDDGEWISWDWISGQLADQGLRQEYPNANLEVVKIFHDLIALAETYKRETVAIFRSGASSASSMPRSSMALCAIAPGRVVPTAESAMIGSR
jgi:hypothetical protein